VQRVRTQSVPYMGVTRIVARRRLMRSSRPRLVVSWVHRGPTMVMRTHAQTSSCLRCGTEFTLRANGRGRQKLYCSRACKEQVRKGWQTFDVRARRFVQSARDEGAYKIAMRHDPCSYCGRQNVQHNDGLDHIEPRSAEGPNTWDNRAAICGGCNASKGTLSLLGFLGRKAWDRAHIDALAERERWLAL
jgi:5-methylcytosine-specific restriction endonuclease McrA